MDAGAHHRPAIVVNGRMDRLAATTLGRAMHSSVYESMYTAPAGNTAGTPPSLARYTLLNPDVRRFYPHWDTAVVVCVAILRATAGRDPHDKAMHDLVGKLPTRSQDFHRLWGAHDVGRHGAGTKTFHHSTIGNLDLACESTDFISGPGLILTVYTAEPASPTAERLALLASWVEISVIGGPTWRPAPERTQRQELVGRARDIDPLTGRSGYGRVPIRSGTATTDTTGVIASAFLSQRADQRFGDDPPYAVTST